MRKRKLDNGDGFSPRMNTDEPDTAVFLVLTKGRAFIRFIRVHPWLIRPTPADRLQYACPA